MEVGKWLWLVGEVTVGNRLARCWAVYWKYHTDVSISNVSPNGASLSLVMADRLVVGIGQLAGVQLYLYPESMC